MHFHFQKEAGMKSLTLSNYVFIFITLSIFMSIFPLRAQEYSRGIGIYPGDPKEDFSPMMKIDGKTYRNLALHKPAYQSSGYDFNLTAQLITDGIADSRLPGWVVVTTSNPEPVKRNEREWILDRNPMTRLTVSGPRPWVQVEMAGNYEIPEIDSFDISGSLLVDSLEAKHWEMAVSGSNDGTNWSKLGMVSGDGLPGDTLTGWMRRFYPQNMRLFDYSIKLVEQVHHRFYRLDLNSPNAVSWAIGEFGMFRDGKRAEIGGPYHFISAWKSAGSGEEWVYVDLGAKCTFDRIALYWIRRAAAGAIQVSDDASLWNEIAPIPSNSGDTDNIKLEKRVKGRYVRVLMTKPASDDGYILSELQVFGTGGPIPIAHDKPPVGKDKEKSLDLAGGAWKIQRASLVNSDGGTISQTGFNDKDWVIATVPATALVSYLNAGALPDPNFGDNQFLISDSYFYSDFWYRDVFHMPSRSKGEKLFLNFDGINWKAEVYLNGKKLGRIEGAFTRAHFDITDVLVYGKENVLAVRIIKNDKPGFVKEQTKLSHDANGGELGADNPTFHASVGWDWIPTIRGRDIGIWNDVYLSATGPVAIEDPCVSSDLPLPDTSVADINVEAALHNYANEKINGTLIGIFGDVKFKEPIVLDSYETKTIRLSPPTNPSLRLKNPRLWWPNGYGAQNLYDVHLKFVTSDGRESDSKSLKTGIRKMTYSEDGGALKIWVNGKRFVAKGGNWGFPESMLRYRTREYKIAVRYHKEMNFTMIRDWVGQTADDAFYDACDEYGIMVWQDFWLANPFDGPNPDNNAMFLQNAEDFVKRIRNHPSIGLYCGRNEGNPPDVIDSTIKKMLPILHPGIHYIPNSAFGVVSGGGPYRAMPVKFYFEERATARLHSELGMPNVVSYESLKRMLPDSALWPINTMWGIHDFTLESAQYGDSFIKQISDDFGSVDSLRDWLQYAQWINYQGYRAMFEAQGKNRMGVLLWMSHPAWPSMVWQTYDYYFDPTAAYFGCKKACEPLHIQWNAFTDSIEVVNYSIADGSGLTAAIEIFDINGAVRLKKEMAVNCPEDSVVHCFEVAKPEGLTGVYFVRLKLTKVHEVVSENFYWCGLAEDSLKTIRNLPKVEIELYTKVSKKAGTWYLMTRLANRAKTPALMLRLKVVGEKSGEQILPAIYSDNYISLMPGEQRTVKIKLQNADTRGEKPVVVAEGVGVGNSRR
jgi:hypothetical protein